MRCTARGRPRLFRRARNPAQASDRHGSARTRLSRTWTPDTSGSLCGESDCSAWDELAEQVAERRTELQTSMSEAQEELARNFARWDAEGNASGELTIELKSILSKIAYLRTLIRDVDGELETAKAA